MEMNKEQLHDIMELALIHALKKCKGYVKAAISSTEWEARMEITDYIRSVEATVMHDGIMEVSLLKTREYKADIKESHIYESFKDSAYIADVVSEKWRELE